LSSDDCKVFWGETLKSVLPDEYYDGPGLLKPYPWTSTTEVTVNVDLQNTKNSGEGNYNGEESSNGSKPFEEIWSEVKGEVTCTRCEAKGKAKLAEAVESWLSADVFDAPTPTTLSPSDNPGDSPNSEV
jgi:hypothetical protein